jgi:hypothetical protein
MKGTLGIISSRYRRSRLNAIRKELWDQYDHATQPMTRINVLKALMKLESEGAKTSGLVSQTKVGRFNKSANILGDEEK